MDNDLNKLEQKRREIVRQLVSQDKLETRALRRDEDVVQSKISRSASEFLRANGFRADGSKRKK